MTYLNDNVLVLNRGWMAIDVARARDIFGRLVNDQCFVLHGVADMNDKQPFTYNQWREFSYGYTGADIVRTVGYQLRVPSVVLLSKFDKLPKKEVRFTRESIYQRDRFRCQYCGERFDKRELNLDHIVPREQGGETNWTNIVCACIKCNSYKSNRRPSEAGMRLLSVPTRPNWRTMCHMQFSNVMKPDWEMHLDVASWPVEVSGHEVTV